MSQNIEAFVFVWNQHLWSNALAIITEFCYNKGMNSSTQKRKRIVKQAVANERLEGLKVSKESQQIAGSYVTGEASAKQAAAKIRARYGSL